MQNKTKKIGVIGTRGFPYIEGGVEKHCETIYPLLAEEMDIIVFRRKSYVSGGTKYKNIRFIDLPSTKIKGLEALLHSLLASIVAIWLRLDIVHFHNIGPGLCIPLVKLFGISTVLTYHSPNYEHKKWGPLSKLFLRFCEYVALYFADRIVFVNRFQMEKYPERIQKKSEYIPNGVSRLQASQNRSYLDQIGVEAEKYVLSVGRITPEKGFDTLIRSFKEYGPEGYKLVIAGGVEFENAYMEELRMLSQDAPVVFTGFVQGDNLAQLYSHAALFVLASENEGFPLVLLEAMRYCRNVLVSDISATRLVNLEEEDYFSVGETKMLGYKMLGKLKNKHSREYDLSEYDWEKVANRISSILNEVYDKQKR